MASCRDGINRKASAVLLAASSSPPIPSHWTPRLSLPQALGRAFRSRFGTRADNCAGPH